MHRFYVPLATFLPCVSFGVVPGETLSEVRGVHDAAVSIAAPDLKCDAGTEVRDVGRNVFTYGEPD